jgi:hypothetical protein
MEWTFARRGCAGVARHALAAACFCISLSWGGVAHAQRGRTCTTSQCAAVAAERFTWFGSKCSGCEAPIAVLSAISVASSVGAVTTSDSSAFYAVMAITVGAFTTGLAAYDAGKNAQDLNDGRWLMPVVGGVAGLAAIAFGVVGVVRHEQAAALSCGPKGCKPGVPAPVVWPEANGGEVMMLTLTAGVF